MTTLRPLNESDIPKLVDIWNILNPDWLRSSPDQLDSYQKRDPKFHYAAWVAEDDQGIIGAGHSQHSLGSFHPRKFFLELYVHPDFQGQGLGKKLYVQILENLEPFDPILLRVQVRETSPRAIRFFDERGFTETKRDWESTLDVSQADIFAYEGLEQNLKEQDIALTTLADISDPEKFRIFHALFSEVRLDTPRSEPATPISFDFFMENVIKVPEFDPKAFLVAVHNGNQIGFSGLYPITATTMLDQWLTAVKRDYRGKHVALALKIRSIAFAKKNGYTLIRTDNDSRNAPMLAINNKLGFKRGAASLSLAKVLQEFRSQ
jgi:mycothiol synthase